MPNLVVGYIETVLKSNFGRDAGFAIRPAMFELLARNFIDNIQIVLHVSGILAISTRHFPCQAVYTCKV